MHESTCCRHRSVHDTIIPLKKAYILPTLHRATNPPSTTSSMLRVFPVRNFTVTVYIIDSKAGINVSKIILSIRQIFGKNSNFLWFFGYRRGIFSKFMAFLRLHSQKVRVFHKKGQIRTQSWKYSTILLIFRLFLSCYRKNLRIFAADLRKLHQFIHRIKYYEYIR